MSDATTSTKSPYYSQVKPAATNGTLLQYTIIVTAVAIFAALTIPFAVHENSILQANNYDGIDNVITGSIKKETKRYRIRRSILDAN